MKLKKGMVVWCGNVQCKDEVPDEKFNKLPKKVQEKVKDDTESKGKSGKPVKSQS